jgi:ribosomal protein S18 acetylase RimI-like enzyme
MQKNITYRRTLSSDFNRCVEVRGRTRQNPVSAERLAELGITRDSQGPLFDDGSIIGFVAESQGRIIGFCSGDTQTGEVLVLALLPGFESLGIGKNLLGRVVAQLFESGFEKLWLAASPDPVTRAHGFYRHLGWIPSGKIDDRGDEILELSA